MNNEIWRIFIKKETSDLWADIATTASKYYKYGYTANDMAFTTKLVNYVPTPCAREKETSYLGLPTLYQSIFANRLHKKNINESFFSLMFSWNLATILH